jgi:hypothetical protein
MGMPVPPQVAVGLGEGVGLMVCDGVPVPVAVGVAEGV